jgi:hypothetical protein
MKDYKQYIIKKGDIELGILWSDIKKYLLTPNEFERFESYMEGQTCSCIDDDCKVNIVFTGDFVRFIKGLPNND